jgi:hypothetical protein
MAEPLPNRVGVCSVLPSKLVKNDDTDLSPMIQVHSDAEEGGFERCPKIAPNLPCPQTAVSASPSDLFEISP